MLSNVHEVLDGDRSAASLRAPERARLAELEQAIAEAVAPLQAEPAPDLTNSIMARFARAHVAPAGVSSHGAGRASWLRLLWDSRQVTFRIRPVLAAAALVVLIPLGLSMRSPAPVAPAPTAARLYVRFRLDSPDANSVALAGSFTDWSPRYELRETESGVWSVLVPLQPGVHQYGFIVDGDRWVSDPLAAQVDDGFGGSNSQLALLAPESL